MNPICQFPTKQVGIYRSSPTIVHMDCMNTAKTLDSTAPPSVTVAPMPTDAPNSERKPLGTPTADLLKALSGIPSGYTDHKQFRRERDAMFDWEDSDDDVND